MEKISASQAAKRLGISVDKVEILEKQGLIHSTQNTTGASIYSSSEIEQIKSRRGPTLSEEAAQVGAQIQQEVFTGVSSLLRSRKTYTILGAVVSSCLVLSFIILSILFYKYPLQMSDYFGYYYRFNSAKQQASLSSGKEGNVLAASTGPGVVSTKTSILADIMKPVAAVSLIAVKAVDSQKYTQIVTNPAEASALNAPMGTSLPGTNGTNGADGQPGLTGPQGLTGPSGANGTNGSNGSNGTSVADILTTPGSLIIRNGTNTTVPLSAGSNGQVLTISSGIPAWENSSTTATNFTGLLAGDVSGTQGLTTVAKINGAVLGTTTATSGNLLIGSGTQWVTQAFSNDATINSSGALTLKNTGTSGTYGSASNIPVFVTDAQGRVTSVTNTAIAGLTTVNFGSANISQWTNNSGYLTTEADTLASVTGRGATTTTALTLSNISNAITAGALTATGGTINGTSIGATSPTTGVFTTINGLTITNNGTNTLTIAVGKTFSVNNSITFGGTDGTTFTLPATSDTLVGKASTDTFTNKTIAAGSNTITGLTNSNLSSSAGITNANLANSSITASGNSGSASVSLGGGLTFSGSGITNITAAGSTLTVTSTEADTLQSVFNRGNTIPTTSGSPANTIDQATISVGNIASTAQQNLSTLNFANGGTGYLDIEVIRGFINFQGTNQLYDDFTDRVLDTTNRWTATATGTGSSCALLAGGLNGLLRMAAGGAANRRCELSTQATLTNGYYQRGNNPIFETKLKIDAVTNVRIFAGFTNTAPTAGNDSNVSTQHAYIEKLAAGTQFQCVTDNGGATETATSTGVTVVANTFYRLRTEVKNGTTPETVCTIDDGTTVTRTVVTATQPGATSAMDIYGKVETSNATGKNMDVDYIRAWQDDPAPGLTIDNKSTATTITDLVDKSTTDVTVSATPVFSEKVASDSGSLVELVTNSVNNFFKNLVEFFGNVIFHADVTFLGRPTFNKDTAGHALIKQGESEISVIFEKEYAQNPVVTANVNLVGSVKADEIPMYAVYDFGAKGFKIKLSKSAPFDLNFSWIALAVNGDNTSTSNVSGTPILSPIPTVIPSATPSPSPEIVPSQTATQSASPSAEPLP